MTTLLLFIIILGILVFVHELGHFLVAKRNGIKAEEFGFGFPPRIIGVVKDEKTGKFKWLRKIEENREYENTIYSINLIPLGGFVRIKGENGEEKGKDSFAGKSAWVRIKVLAAGVIMNFLLAWILLSLVLFLGAPQAVSDSENVDDAKIQIAEVVQDTPAEEMGLQIGDEVVSGCEDGSCENFNKVKEFQQFIKGNQGEEIVLNVKRGSEEIELSGVPREEFPDDQGSLGVSLARTTIVSYPWYEAIWKGLESIYNFVIIIFVFLGDLIRRLFAGEGVSGDVAGPVGIAFMTGQVAELGFVYVLQFIALLSINLGIINALPFPALDGGRMLFIIIEKIKGSPVSQRVEQAFHLTGFALLILLMIIVTFRDFIRFEVIDKIINFF